MSRIIKCVTATLLLASLFHAPEGYSAAADRINYQIQGLSPAFTAAIRARLDYSLRALQPIGLDAIQAWYSSRAPIEIQNTLALYGYFKPSVHARLFYHNKHWQAMYRILPGPLLKIKQLTLSMHGEGASHATLQKRLTELPLHQGDSFLSEQYEQAKQTLLTAVIAEGYLSAHFAKQQVLIDRRSYAAYITLTLETGPRYYFGPVIFQTNILKHSFLKRYLPFCVGDPYSFEQLVKLQENLDSSGYFQHISIIDGLTVKKQGQQIPILLKLTPQSAQQYTAGIGYSTDIGMKATLGWKSRYLNKFGHKLSIIGQLSQRQNSLQATYTIPGQHPNTDSYNLNFVIVRRLLAQVDSTIQAIGITSVKQWKTWQSNLFLNYQIEHFNYANRATVISSHLLMPGVNFSRSQFDDNLYPLHGYRINLRLQGADKNILSSASFLQTQLQTKRIMSWNDNSRLILRAELGYTLTPDPNTFPPSLLFYAGGSQSIRGYAYQSLGPGRYLMVGSAEYQHRLINDFYGAVFFDVGNAVNNFPINLRKGAGVGLVWVSPLGPMELTLGKALDLPGQPLRLQFSIGIDLL